MDEKTTYIALGISASASRNTKDGFTSYKEAEEYVVSMACPTCKKLFEKGYEEPDYDDEYEENDPPKSISINSITDTACGEEWCILSHEEMQDLADIDDPTSSERFFKS